MQAGRRYLVEVSERTRLMATTTAQAEVGRNQVDALGAGEGRVPVHAALELGGVLVRELACLVGAAAALPQAIGVGVDVLVGGLLVIASLELLVVVARLKVLGRLIELTGVELGEFFLQATTLELLVVTSLELLVFEVAGLKLLVLEVTSLDVLGWLVELARVKFRELLLEATAFELLVVAGLEFLVVIAGLELVIVFTSFELLVVVTGLELLVLVVAGLEFLGLVELTSVELGEFLLEAAALQFVVVAGLELLVVLTGFKLLVVIAGLEVLGWLIELARVKFRELVLKAAAFEFVVVVPSLEFVIIVAGLELLVIIAGLEFFVLEVTGLEVL